MAEPERKLPKGLTEREWVPEPPKINGPLEFGNTAQIAEIKRYQKDLEIVNQIEGRCPHCDGEGTIVCPECEGQG